MWHPRIWRLWAFNKGEEILMALEPLVENKVENVEIDLPLNF